MLAATVAMAACSNLSAAFSSWSSTTGVCQFSIRPNAATCWRFSMIATVTPRPSLPARSPSNIGTTSSANRTTEAAAILDGVVSHLTVVDPRHGLAGQRLELVTPRSGRGPAFVVVRLPDGRHRSIRRSATDLATASSEEEGASKSLACISVRTLLTLMHHLHSTLASRIEEVIRDEHAIESTPRSVPDPHRTSKPGDHDTPETLARFAGGDAAADRVELRATASEDATNPRADKGGSAC
ncbi:hypothetical protein V1281_007015 [Nitrobacteraceae bacterium AZCC 2161]